MTRFLKLIGDLALMLATARDGHTDARRPMATTATTAKPLSPGDNVPIFQRPFTRQEFEGRATVIRALRVFDEHDGARFEFCVVRFRGYADKICRWVELSKGQQEIESK